VGDRLADFVDDAARDHCAWRKREVDVLEHGAFTELQGSSTFEWSPLSVRDLDIPASSRLELVAPGGELRQRIPALGVRHGRGGSAQIPRAPFVDTDFHPAQRFTRIGTHDAPADHARPCAWVLRLIPRGQLCRHRPADEEQADEDDELCPGSE
jgi:hypothetical protein